MATKDWRQAPLSNLTAERVAEALAEEGVTTAGEFYARMSTPERGIALGRAAQNRGIPWHMFNLAQRTVAAFAAQHEEGAGA